jgi:hypothetical protein
MPFSSGSGKTDRILRTMLAYRRLSCEVNYAAKVAVI